jgi:cytochrome P450
MDTKTPEEVLDRIPDDFMQKPYELLKRYRDAGRVHHVIFPHGADVWLITRYDDVRDLLQDSRVLKDGSRMNEMFARHTGTYVEGEKPDVGFDDELSIHMLNSDPPRHTRLRSLVSKSFTLRTMEKLRGRVEEIVDEHLERLEGHDNIDLVAEYALPVPVDLICTVLGIPHDDRNSFRRWAVELVGAGQPPEVVRAATDSIVAYARECIKDKRANPSDDLISGLLPGRDGDALTDDELVTMIFLFTVAGHVTSQHTLSNGVFHLLRNPDQLKLLRDDPELIRPAVDELIRYDGGVGVATFRFTGEEVQVGDTVIPPNQIMALSVLSAHRDERRYPDPDRLDVQRRPNGILGFGHGPHFCIGQPLAKIQTEIALRKLILRYPDLRFADGVDPDSLEWESSPLLRGLITLPVATTPLGSGR